MPRPTRDKVHFAPMPMADEGSSEPSGNAFSRIREIFGVSEVFIAAVAWSASSISMTVLNKLVVTHSHAPMAVVVVQMIATVGVSANSRDLHFGEGWKLWAMAVCPLYSLMMLTSMLALKYVTVGTFVVVRFLGPLVTLIIETLWHKPESLHFDAKTAGATSAIAIGVLIYEAREISFSFVGFLFLLANLGLATTERMVQRHLLAIKKVDVSKPALMMLNNGLGALFGLVLIHFTASKEWHTLYHALKFRRGTGWAVLASCGVGTCISYTGLWLQSLVTATTFQVVGSCTKLIVIAWGIMIMGDAHGVISIFGAMLSLGGSYAYSQLK